MNSRRTINKHGMQDRMTDQPPQKSEPHAPLAAGSGAAILRADPQRASTLTRTLTGAEHLLWGLRVCLTTPSLLGLSAMIVAANVVVYAALLFAGYWVSDDVAAYLANWAPSIFRWDWAGTALRIVILLGWAIACLLLAVFVAALLTSPLLEKVSEITEQLLTGDVRPLPFAVGPIFYEIFAELVLLIVSVIVGLFATVTLFWIPGLGQAIPLVISAVFVTWSFMAPAAVRHQVTIRQRLAMLRNNKALMIGFGLPAGVFPFLLVPLLTPALVVGATRLYLSLAVIGRAPGRATAQQTAILASPSPAPLRPRR